MGNEHPNTLTANLINRVGESDAFISGSTPESEGQKVDFGHKMGILFLLLFFISKFCYFLDCRLNLVLIY